jgi:hypothetical protein
MILRMMRFSAANLVPGSEAIILRALQDEQGRMNNHDSLSSSIPVHCRQRFSMKVLSFVGLKKLQRRQGRNTNELYSLAFAAGISVLRDSQTKQ